MAAAAIAVTDHFVSSVKTNIKVARLRQRREGAAQFWPLLGKADAHLERRSLVVDRLHELCNLWVLVWYK